MAKPAYTIDTGAATGFAADDAELSTSHLTGTIFADPEEIAGQNVEDTATPAGGNTDWIALLAARPAATQPIEDALPPPEPVPSGMAAHAAPPRMRPTFGVRVAAGLRRGTLLLVVSALAIGALAAGAYTIYSTAWVSPVSAPVSEGPARNGGSAQGEGQSPVSPPQSAGGSSVAPQAPGDAQGLKERGIELYRAGDFAEAINLLEAAVSLGGGDALTYYQFGLAYMAVPDREHGLEDAEMAFRTASSLEPQWAAPHQLLAESLVRRGYFSEAIEPAVEATRLDPAQPEAWMTLGRAYAGAGRQAEATHAFAEASKHAPAPPTR